jgi:hypothetical protein
MRQKLLAFPQRVAPEVYAAEKLVEVKSILKDNIYDALQEISDVKVKVINPIRSSDSGEDQQAVAGNDAAAAKSND